MKKIILAISREYGSGGTSVSKKLAAELGIPFYDKNIIEMAAEKSGLSSDYINSVEQNLTSSYLFNLVSSTSYNGGLTAPQYDVPLSYTAFSAQAAVIHDLANKGSCVILGRCADYILQDDPDCVKIFIYADMDYRVSISKDSFGLDARKTEAKLQKIDKGRANYYKTFTSVEWGVSRTHDLCVNIARCGIDGAVATIKEFLKGSGYID